MRFVFNICVSIENTVNLKNQEIGLKIISTKESMKESIKLRTLVFFTMMLFSLHIYAGAYSSWAVPTELEYVNDGVLISGEFSNPGSCTVANKVFISRASVGTDKFQSMLSIVLTALTAKKEIKLRSDYCFNVTFHGQNVSESRTAVYIR